MGSVEGSGKESRSEECHARYSGCQRGSEGDFEERSRMTTVTHSRISAASGRADRGRPAIRLACIAFAVACTMGVMVMVIDADVEPLIGQSLLARFQYAINSLNHTMTISQ
jgi:hypothetical protein